MRQEATAFRTRDSRQRFLTTNPGTAALHREIEATREYQGDSSSKRPAGRRFQLLLHRTHPPWIREFDKRSFYIRSPYRMDAR